MSGHQSNDYKCEECGKYYATPWTLRRHKEHIHPEEDDDSETAKDSTETSDMEDDYESSNGSSDDEEESDDTMSISDEVEVVGELLSEVIHDMAYVTSMDDLTDETNYQKIMEAFKEKVGDVLYH